MLAQVTQRAQLLEIRDRGIIDLQSRQVGRVDERLHHRETGSSLVFNTNVAG